MLSILELERKVVKNDLCTNCGACQGMCPYWKSFEGRTFVDYECDRNEGRCKYFCPRMPADLGALMDRFFDAKDIIPQLGAVKELYLTRAADPQIRAKAQHGGSVTALVELALAEGFIDAAVLSQAGKAQDGTLDPAGCIVTDPADVRKCSGSSFQIPPTLAVLNEALKEDEYKSIGLVGTPCKSLAAYKMMSKPFEDNDNNADNIGMVFGLFCGWGLDWKGMEALGDAGHVDILPSKYHRMDMDDRQVDLDEVLPLVRKNCEFCYDMTAEFADISIGGARSSEGWDVDKGWNQLIVRSEKGQKLVELAREKGVLEFREFGGEDAKAAALDKLKNASASKKAKAVKALTEAGGDLGYLEPSREAFAEYLK
ncbi:MAG: Coenzyme F420 hydrogenase/dehydrogenase, beta subunit C-terminal domain [Bacillota bacterium]|nr:Coenzyme F420 hydrogenase/dehydrogenase, beta subunit C-terminal domain [Bacillota bacterium]